MTAVLSRLKTSGGRFVIWRCDERQLNGSEYFRTNLNVEAAPPTSALKYLIATNKEPPRTMGSEKMNRPVDSSEFVRMKPLVADFQRRL
jgi:hypothetical protein